MAYPFIIQGGNIVVVIGNQSHTISKTHITYDMVVAAIKAGDWDTVKDVIEPKQVVLNYGKGNVTINGETLLWKGQEFHNSLATRMIQMLKEDFPLEPMVNLMENLMQNPSKRAVSELYGFLEKCNLPVTPDGHFLAFKKVRANGFDCYSGKMDNNVGQIVEMERNFVDDDKDRTCSTGLHFCSQSYLAHFGGERTMIVKINPRDVVSIPSDYNDAKGRACRYEVIGELAVKPEDAFVKSVQRTAVGSQPVSRTRAERDAETKANEPKAGQTDFYRGYTAGYTRIGRTPGVNTRSFNEGYDKGCAHFAEGRPAKYQFKAPSVAPVAPVTPFDSGLPGDWRDGLRWPQPATSFGRPISK